MAPLGRWLVIIALAGCGRIGFDGTDRTDGTDGTVPNVASVMVKMWGAGGGGVAADPSVLVSPLTNTSP